MAEQKPKSGLQDTPEPLRKGLEDEEEKKKREKLQKGMSDESKPPKSGLIGEN